MSQSQPIIYRINDAMRQMGISRATIYRLVKAEKLDLVKISIRASGITSESINRHLKSSN
ncbi:helix-turn-helix transcriptional regulator [Undibacterium sp. SXout20W]|uniref:helix-turn-helix transcriptional regulator n=1 Tax=Undibacterium sp. SXout20W TaxID=3413051 RepID=UPI003BF1BA26